MGRLLYVEMLDEKHFKTLSDKKLIDVKDAEPNKTDITKRERVLILKIAVCEALLCLSYVASKKVFGEPSRRLCNLPYVLYQVALINSYTCYLLLIDRLLIVRYTNMVDNAINYGQLQFFIWANLLTGLINLVIKTYYATLLVSILIMVVYFMVQVVIINNCKKCHCCKRVF